MKIYKISQNFQMIPQDPNIPNNPDVQLQNLQNSQAAIQYFQEVMAASDQIMASLRALEDTLGLGDIGLRSQFENTIKQAAASTPAFNLLTQMNMISSIDNLLDQGELTNVQTLINTNIQSISSQRTGTMPSL
jgi:hypothetical protein